MNQAFYNMFSLLSTSAENNGLKEQGLDDFWESDEYLYFSSLPQLPKDFFKLENKSITEMNGWIDEKKELKELHEKAAALLAELIKTRSTTMLWYLDKPDYFDVESMRMFYNEMLEIQNGPRTENISNLSLNNRLLFNFFDMEIIDTLDSFYTPRKMIERLNWTRRARRSEQTKMFGMSGSEEMYEMTKEIIGNPKLKFIIEKDHYNEYISRMSNYHQFYALKNQKFVGISDRGRKVLQKAEPVFKLLKRQTSESGYRRLDQNDFKVIEEFLKHRVTDRHIIHEAEEVRMMFEMLRQINKLLATVITQVSYDRIVAAVKGAGDLNHYKNLEKLHAELLGMPKQMDFVTNLKDPNVFDIPYYKVRTRLPRKTRRLLLIDNHEEALNEFFRGNLYSISSAEISNAGYHVRWERDEKQRCRVCGRRINPFFKKETRVCFRHRPVKETLKLTFSTGYLVFVIVALLLVGIAVQLFGWV